MTKINTNNNKTDQELLNLFDDKENTPEDYHKYEDLSGNEKSKIFDLVLERGDKE